MASVPILPTISLAVGQQVEIYLSVAGSSADSVWLACDAPQVIAPALAGGTLLEWPYEISLSGGAATFYLQGAGTGEAELAFVTEIDPPDPNAAGIYLGVVATTILETGEDDPGDEGEDPDPMAIAEPIIISLVAIPEPPAGGPV